MGLFGGKQTYVSSVLYSLAGDELDRPNYLKTLVMGGLLTSNNFSIGDVVRKGYLASPGIKFRRFMKWAEEHYTQVGVPKGHMGGSVDIDLDLIAPEMPHELGEVVHIQAADIGPADFSWWAEQWMLTHEPTLLGTLWTADISNDTGLITITFEDTTTESFVPIGFNKEGVYLYIAYHTYLDSGTFNVSGTIYDLGDAPFPSTVGWTPVSATSGTTEPALVETIKTTSTFSDGRPNETSTVTNNSLGSYTEIHEIYTKTEYQGQDDELDTDRIYSLKQTMYFDQIAEVKSKQAVTQQTVEIAPGVTKTTFVDTRTEYLVLKRTHRTDLEKIVHQDWRTSRIHIHEYGSGNIDLDRLISQEFGDGEYYPFIPIRVDNKFLSDSYNPVAYEQSRQAYKKSVGESFDDLIDKLKDNPDLDEIDYAYIMFGVPLNTRDKSSIHYLYKFWDRCRNVNNNTNAEFLLWKQGQQTLQERLDEFETWKEAQGDPDHPEFGDTTNVADIIKMPKIKPKKYVKIQGAGPFRSNMLVEISWIAIERVTGIGLQKPDTFAGDYYITLDATTPEAYKAYLKGDFYDLEPEEFSVFRIFHQIDADNWECLVVTGALHTNSIYDGKSVRISAKDAMNDADPSGFLVPLHDATTRDMSLVSSNQVIINSAYLVLNSYQVVKKKWYQTGIFKIFLFVVAIAVTVIFAPAGAGLLGANIAVGTAAGFAGTAAVIAGAVINAIAAMVVINLITTGSQAVFGNKIGSIIGAVASIIALQVGSTLMSGGSLAGAWGNLMSAQNILGMTNAVGNGVAGYVRAATQETILETQELVEDYEKEMIKIADYYEENFGYDRGVFDPLNLTDVNFGNFMETQEQFLTRTLMTGSDVAEMSMDMITDFAGLTLSTDLPLSR